MPDFRFLHAADIHLDSPLVGLARNRDLPADVVADVTRRAFTNLIDAALAEGVDFVVIAGDLYDGDWRDHRTGLFFVAEAARLTRAGIPVVVLHGNHDAASTITKRLTLPDGVHVLPSRRPGSVELDRPGVVLHGRSFPTRDVADDLTVDYPPAVPGRFNIGVLHTALTGRPGHAGYAPTDLDQLRARGYDYWALGHVHRREVVARDPWVVFPGNLQGRHARETGAKGASLVEVTDGRVADCRHLALDVVRWAAPVVDLTGVHGIDDALARVRAAATAAAEAAEGRPLLLRLDLRGRTPLAGRLQDTADAFDAECRAAAAAVAADVHVEKVVLAVDGAEAAAPAAVAAELADPLRRLLDAGRDDSEALDALREELRAIFARLPDAVLLADEPDRPDEPEGLARIVADARSLLAARLGPGDAGG